MSIPTTYISLHAVDRIVAFEGNVFGLPLALTFMGEQDMRVTVFFAPDGDPGYTKALVEAINGVSRSPATLTQAGRDAEQEHRDAHDAAAAANYIYTSDAEDVGSPAYYALTPPTNEEQKHLDGLQRDAVLALREIAALNEVESDEPLDDAIRIARAALAPEQDK